LQRFLLLVIASGAVLFAAPFSHRLHLGQGIQCLDCHAAAAQSTKIQDNLLPDKKACVGCHEDRVIPAPPVMRLSNFNHALHLRIGNVAPFIASAIDHKTYLQPPGEIRRHLNGKNPCQACHRGLEESDQVTRAALPQMADCLVCHTQIDPPFSCEDCHAKDTHLKPASHVERFTDAHSSGKLKLDKTTCTVCHGRAFTCMGCH
jgi:hypothetical protein